MIHLTLFGDVTDALLFLQRVIADNVVVTVSELSCSWPLYHSRSITSGWLWLTVLWFVLYYSPCVTHPTMDLHRLCYHLTLCHMSAWVQLLQLTSIGVLSLHSGYVFPLSCIDSVGLMLLALLNEYCFTVSLSIEYLLIETVGKGCNFA